MASIRKRNGSYQITVSCGYDIRGKKAAGNNHIHPRSVPYPQKQEKAVQDFAMEFEAKVRNGILPSGGRLPCRSTLPDGLMNTPSPISSLGLFLSTRRSWKTKSFPLGHYKLSELKPHIVNAFFVSLSKDGARKDGRPGGYSKGSIMKTRNVLSSFCGPLYNGKSSIPTHVTKSKCKKMDVAEKVSFFTPEQTIRFLEYIEQPYTVQVKGHKRVDDTGKPIKWGITPYPGTFPSRSGCCSTWPSMPAYERASSWLWSGMT